MPAAAERTPLLSGRHADDDYKRSSYTNQPRQQGRPHPYPHYAAPSSSSAPPASSYQPVPYSAPNSPFSPRPPRPAAAHSAARNDAVRRNLFTFLTAHLQLCLALTLLLPQVMAITLVLATHWDTDTCDQPLHIWAAVYGARLCLSLFLSVLPFLPGRVFVTLSAALLSPSATELLHIFSLVWFILGNYWLFHATECQATAPAVFQLVSALLLLNCVLLFLPLLLFLLLCPFLYFCAPWMVRLTIAIQELSRARRGLPPDVIQMLPSLTYPQRYQQQPSQQQHSRDGAVSAVERQVGETDARGEGESGTDSSGTVWPAECSICLSSFSAGDKCRLLGCHPTHVFHAACIDSWLQLNASCPICRHEVDVTGMTRDAASRSQQQQQPVAEARSAEDVRDATRGAAGRARAMSSEEARRWRAEQMV